MATATLTGANSVIMLSIVGLFPIPQQLQGYAADNVLATEAVKSIETIMGIDGRLSAGWFPTMKIQTYTLQGDSPSVVLFEAWQQNQEAVRDAFVAQGVITLPGIKRVYNLTNGYLTDYSPMPDIQKIIQPRKFQITWQSILPAPIG